MKKLLLGIATALSLFSLPALADDCVAVNAAGSVGYVNVRVQPDINSPVLIRWNNPERGSDWGSAYYCGENYTDYAGRTWSFIGMQLYDGRIVKGWVSNKVLQFLW